jgi:AraC-like DNA-binding protein
MLETGVARALFGAEAHELAERHTSVEDVWGLEARYLWEQLREAKTLETQLDHFEVFLARKLPQVHGMHPAIAHALSRFPSTTNIGGIVDETGYSHRRFIELFRRTVGLPPRLFTRVLRFQRALKSIAGKSRVSWIDLALEAGYSDQAHFNREFREFSGVSPTEYLKLTDGESLHVPILSKARGR